MTPSGQANPLTLLTAAFALAAALAGIMVSRCNARCLLAKNEAILAQSRATDLWAFYQSRNIRAEVSELGLGLASGAKARAELGGRIQRLRGEREKLFGEASRAEAERDRLNRRSDGYLAALKSFASSLALLQIALALSPVYLYVRRNLVLWAALVVGGSGVFALAVGWARYLGLP